MALFTRLLLLADVAVLVFVRFRVEQAWMFYLLAGMLIPLGWASFAVTFLVSRKQFLLYYFPGDRRSGRDISLGDQNSSKVAEQTPSVREASPQIIIPLASASLYSLRAHDEGAAGGESRYGRLGIVGRRLCFLAKTRGKLQESGCWPIKDITEIRYGMTEPARRMGMICILTSGEEITFLTARAELSWRELIQVLGREHEE